MGGEYYSRTVKAKTDEEAVTEFKEIVKQCKYDYGHAGYTGTFAEKSEIKILPLPKGRRADDNDKKRFWTEEELQTLADDVNKWEHAIGGKISETEYYLCGWCSS